MHPQASSHREELRRLVRDRVVLRTSPENPIRDIKGREVPWALDSWGLTATSDGLRMAALSLLERLKSDFEATQLASYGYSSLPLVTACVLLGEGRYTGLAVRKDRKAYGACRMIEGNGDKSRPVVVIDDSISSGTALRKALEHLEDEGYMVEGSLSLVNFPFRGGKEFAEALGYRVETIFGDVWRDLEIPLREPVAQYRQIDPPWDAETKLPDGLHPATAARRVAEHFLLTGRVPRPPDAFDAEPDGRGGVYVSFREKATEKRLGRDGFWHFDPSDADVCRDVVLATYKTVKAVAADLRKTGLEPLKIGLSFLGPLESISPRRLDFSRYGIIVQSRPFPMKRGGALPNTQVFTSEIEQYHHACKTNARMTAFEPHDLFRHTVVKCVEPGETWLPYGETERDTAWKTDDRIGAALVERVGNLLRAKLTRTEPVDTPVSDDLIPIPLSALAVTVYNRGVAGCRVSWEGSLDDCLAKAAFGALEDSRFKERLESLDPDNLTFTISLLHDREWFGKTTLEKAARKLRLGLDSIAVRQGNKRAVLLNSVAVHHNRDKEEMCRRVLKKAGIAGPPHEWATFQTTTWSHHAGRIRPVEFGFPKRASSLRTVADYRDEIARLGEYVLRHIGPDGIPNYCYYPYGDHETRFGTSGRVVHALTTLDSAGRMLDRDDFRTAARRGFSACLEHLKPTADSVALELPERTNGAMAECTLLAGLLKADVPDFLEPARKLAAKILSFGRPDGSMSSLPVGRKFRVDHDFLGGAALLVLADFRAAGEPLEPLPLDKALGWYRKRFRLVHPWGMVGWHAQAWAAWHELTGHPEQADFVFELADWALEFQHEGTGAFLSDLDPTGPSFHTGFLLEGIAAAWTTALRLGDAERAAKYEHSWRAGMDFMDSLTIREEDAYCLTAPERSLGGVRQSRVTSRVRIDFVGHQMIALMKGVRNLQ